MQDDFEMGDRFEMGDHFETGDCFEIGDCFETSDRLETRDHFETGGVKLKYCEHYPRGLEIAPLNDAFHHMMLTNVQGAMDHYNKVSLEDPYWLYFCMFQAPILCLVRVSPTLTPHAAWSVLVTPSWAQQPGPVMGMNVGVVNTVYTVCISNITAVNAVHEHSNQVQWWVWMSESSTLCTRYALVISQLSMLCTRYALVISQLSMLCTRYALVNVTDVSTVQGVH